MYMLVLGVFSLMVAPMLMLDSPWLRVPLNLALLAGIALLAYNDGGYRGHKEVSRACYHPVRGALPAALAALPFFVAAVALAVLTTPYEYALQGLPTWLTAYLRREDIGGALQYYGHVQGAGAVDYLRIAVRLVMMPAAYIIGGFGDQASLLLDRLSPLLVLFIPGAYAVGYLRGPAIHKLATKRSAEAKRLHQKKVARKKRRERQARAGKGPERLI